MTRLKLRTGHVWQSLAYLKALCPLDDGKTCCKLAHSLISRYEFIALEDAQINGMVRNHHLSNSIVDASWEYLKQRLADKASEAGRRVVLVNPASTSKTCSSRGEYFSHPSLADRWIECSCDLSVDRDVNAALNILQAGHARWDGGTDNGLRLSQEGYVEGSFDHSHPTKSCGWKWPSKRLVLPFSIHNWIVFIKTPAWRYLPRYRST